MSRYRHISDQNFQILFLVVELIFTRCAPVFYIARGLDNHSHENAAENERIHSVKPGPNTRSFLFVSACLLLTGLLH